MTSNASAPATSNRQRLERLRAYPRLSRPLPGRWLYDGTEHVAEIGGANLGGCFVRTTGVCPQSGEVIEVLLVMPTVLHRWRGTVVWCDGSRGFGLKFDEMPAAVRERLALGLEAAGLENPYGP
jgi:hypothetical protein